jgi:hypothetical protein
LCVEALRKNGDQRGAREAVPEADDLAAVETRFTATTQALCEIHC